MIPKTVWITVGLLLVSAFILKNIRIRKIAFPEGFQGSKALRSADLIAVPPYISRKDLSHGVSYKGVPLTIYHSWGTGSVPPKMYENIQRLVELNPEFDYSFNKDEACREFIAAHFEPAVVEAFDCLKPGAFKSDLWRYCVLYKNGGVYIDIKCTPVTKFIDIMKKYEMPLFVLDSPNDFIHSCSWNGFMISAPGNPIFRKCIDEVIKNVEIKSYKGGSLSITGPCLLGKVIHEMMPNYKYKLRDSYRKILDEHGNNIIGQYPEYREEQNLFQKGKHYGEYYRRGDVYSC